MSNISSLLNNPVEDADIKRLAQEVFEKKTSIEVVISANEKIADQIRGMTVAQFRKNA